jgi:hypothetical protein
MLKKNTSFCFVKAINILILFIINSSVSVESNSKLLKLNKKSII